MRILKQDALDSQGKPLPFKPRVESDAATPTEVESDDSADTEEKA